VVRSNTLTTGGPYRSDDSTFWANINPYPLGAGVTAPSPGVRLVINSFDRLRTGVGSEDGKVVSREPDATTLLSRQLWSTQVKV
jgi:hypothetical protein